MQPLSGNQRPDLMASLLNMSLALRLPRKIHLGRSSSNVLRLPSFLEMLHNHHVLRTFDKVHNPVRLPPKTTSERPKVLRTPQFFFHFWLRNVLRGTTACTFFYISTSKSGSELGCFVHFDLEMCFAPQRRARFRHRNFYKWSGAEVFCTFWLRDVLRATTACTFNLQKWSQRGLLCTFWLRNVLRATTACNFSSLICPAGSAPVALASLLFDPPKPQIIGKTQCFATSLPFRGPGSSFFWDFLFSSSFFFSALRWLFPSLLFICPYCRKFDVWLLNFLR